MSKEMSSWADHCSSSDEEGVSVKPRPEIPPEVRETVGMPDDEPSYRPNSVPAHAQGGPGCYRRSTSSSSNNQHQNSNNFFPANPPFRAHVSNVGADISPDVLSEELQYVTKEVTGKEVKCFDCKLFPNKKVDPNNKFNVNFGYVDVDNGDQLSALLEVSDNVQLQCNGNRQVRIQVARPPRNQSLKSSGFDRRDGEADGMRRQSSGPTNGGSGRGGNRRFDRGSSSNSHFSEGGASEIDGTKFRGGIRNKSGSASALMQRAGSAGSVTGGDGKSQRPSLKLAPRTKTTPEGDSSSTAKQSSIFGGAKPRDEGSIVKHKEESKESSVKKGSDDKNFGEGKGTGSARDIRHDNSNKSGKGPGKEGRGPGKEGGGDRRQRGSTTGGVNTKDVRKSGSNRDVAAATESVDGFSKVVTGAKQEKTTVDAKESPAASSTVVDPKLTTTAKEPIPAKKVANMFEMLGMDSDSD